MRKLVAAAPFPIVSKPDLLPLVGLLHRRALRVCSFLGSINGGIVEKKIL